MKSEQINEIAAALSKAQGAMQNAVMDKINPHFRSRYATLASVLDSIRKPLSDNGLAVTQTIGIQNGGMVLTTMLMHTSGQWLSSEYPLPIGKPQEMGSAQTYARRYSLAALVCNSSEEDDDANAAQSAVNGKNNGRDIPAELDQSSITKEQLSEIQALIVEAGADIKRFCTYMKIDRLEQLTPNNFSSAKEALEAKKVKARS